MPAKKKPAESSYDIGEILKNGRAATSECIVVDGIAWEGVRRSGGGAHGHGGVGSVPRGISAASPKPQLKPMTLQNYGPLFLINHHA